MWLKGIFFLLFVKKKRREIEKREKCESEEKTCSVMQKMGEKIMQLLTIF